MLSVFLFHQVHGGKRMLEGVLRLWQISQYAETKINGRMTNLYGKDKKQPGEKRSR